MNAPMSRSGAVGLWRRFVIPVRVSGSTRRQGPNHKQQITSKSQVPKDKHQTSRGQSCPADQTAGLRKTFFPGPRRPRRSGTAVGVSSFGSLEFWCLLFVWDLMLEIWSFAGAAGRHRRPTAPVPIVEANVSPQSASSAQSYVSDSVERQAHRAVGGLDAYLAAEAVAGVAGQHSQCRQPELAG